MEKYFKVIQACEADLLFIYMYTHVCMYTLWIYKRKLLIHVISSVNIEMIHKIGKTDTNTRKEKKTAFKYRISNA